MSFLEKWEANISTVLHNQYITRLRHLFGSGTGFCTEPLRKWKLLGFSCFWKRRCQTSWVLLYLDSFFASDLHFPVECFRIRKNILYIKIQFLVLILSEGDDQWIILIRYYFYRTHSRKGFVRYGEVYCEKTFTLCFLFSLRLCGFTVTQQTVCVYIYIVFNLKRKKKAVLVGERLFRTVITLRITRTNLFPSCSATINLLNYIQL